jgi:hypothetical protein
VLHDDHRRRGPARTRCGSGSQASGPPDTPAIKQLSSADTRTFRQLDPYAARNDPQGSRPAAHTSPDMGVSALLADEFVAAASVTAAQHRLLRQCRRVCNPGEWSAGHDTSFRKQGPRRSHPHVVIGCLVVLPLPGRPKVVFGAGHTFWLKYFLRRKSPPWQRRTDCVTIIHARGTRRRAYMASAPHRQDAHYSAFRKGPARRNRPPGPYCGSRIAVRGVGSTAAVAQRTREMTGSAEPRNGWPL